MKGASFKIEAQLEGEGHVTADWENHQEDVAKLFRNLGCYAEVNAKVNGARAKHSIDVWVVFNQFGITIRWLIECKKWSTPVPKEKVLALRSIMDDVGADRGIIVAHTGFQKGAINAANLTNITLTTLEDLKDLARDSFHRTILDQIEKKLLSMPDRLSSLEVRSQLGPGYWQISFKPGVNRELCIFLNATISILRMGLDRVKTNHYPAPVGFVDANTTKSADNIDDFIKLATKELNDIEQMLGEQESNVYDEFL